MVKGLNSDTITGRINLTAIGLLGKQPDGIRWADLQRQIKEAIPDVHPKTVNGCVWKLAFNFPDRVYKPEKGLFRLTKYK